MKKIKLGFLLLMAATLFTCKKSNSNQSSAYKPDCSATTPNYQNNVAPLVLSACGSSGCHVAGSSKGPGALVTYAQLKAASASVRSSVVSGRMPEGSTLTNDQKNTIVCWIDAGANP